MQQDERTRKNEQVILQGMHEKGLEPIAKAMSRDVSTVSRMKDGEVNRIATLLAACDLKVVPASFRCAKPEVIAALETLARTAMNREQQSLVWDD